MNNNTELGSKNIFSNKCLVSLHAFLSAYYSLNSYISAQYQLSINSNSFMTQLLNLKLVSNVYVLVTNKGFLEQLLCGIISKCGSSIY